MIRAAKSVLAMALAGLLVYAALGHRPAAAAGLPRSAAPRLSEPQSVTRAGASTVVTTIVAKVFTALAAGAGKSLTQVIADDNPALGWLLPAAAQRQRLQTQQLRAINESLDALKQQVAAAQNQIAIDGFTNLVAHTHDIRAAIITASRRLEGLAALPANSPDAVKDANALRTYIGDHLLNAPERLDEVLAPNVPLASNPIEGASRLVMQRDRFFGPSSSAEVTSVYTVFAAYQTQLAVLLQNYYHELPAVYSPTMVRSELDHLQRNIEAQKKSLKPAVPDNTVIDTKTREMWTTNFPTGPGAPAREVPLKTIATIRLEYDGGFPKYHYVLLKPAGTTALGGLPFDNWKLPDVHRFKGLLEGRQGASPFDWLVKAGFNRAFLEAGNGLKWTDETPHVNILFALSSTDVRRFSMRTGQLQSLAVTWGTLSDGWQHWFNRERAGLIYYRTIPADEKYWW
jgi:hypothetical protein